MHGLAFKFLLVGNVRVAFVGVVVIDWEGGNAKRHLHRVVEVYRKMSRTCMMVV